VGGELHAPVLLVAVVLPEHLPAVEVGAGEHPGEAEEVDAVTVDGRRGVRPPAGGRVGRDELALVPEFPELLAGGGVEAQAALLALVVVAGVDEELTASDDGTGVTEADVGSPLRLRRLLRPLGGELRAG